MILQHIVQIHREGEESHTIYQHLVHQISINAIIDGELRMRKFPQN